MEGTVGRSIDFEKAAVGAEGADANRHLLRATGTPTDICIAGLIPVDVAVNAAACKHDSEIFPLWAFVMLGSFLRHFVLSSLTRVLMNT